MQSDIPEPYCHWTPDEGAGRAPILLIRNALAVLSFLSVAYLLVAFWMTRHVPDMSDWWALGGMIALFVCPILAAMAQSAASSAPVRCSRCGKTMRYVQHDYPSTPSSGFTGPADVSHGEDGRLYVRGNGAESPMWYRLMQELRVCDRCERYVVVQRQKFLHVGPDRSDVEEHERQQRTIHKAVERVRHSTNRKNSSNS